MESASVLNIHIYLLILPPYDIWASVYAYPGYNWNVQVPHNKIKKKMCSNMCPETLICELQLKEYCVDTRSSSVWMCWHASDSIGLHVFPHDLTGNHYRDFLLHNMPKLLADVPLAVRTWMWFMRDGASPHFSRAVRDAVSNICHCRWIGRGPTAWPPRSPEDGCQTIRIYPGFFKRMRRSTMRHVEVCIGSHGGHIEH
jgi:hypothetical protein